MGIFTKTEKINPETGKFETTKKGLFNEREHKHTSLTKQLEKQYYKKHPKESPSYKRKQNWKKRAKTFNSVLNTISPPPKRKQQSQKNKKKPSTQYYIKKGKAYPIAKKKNTIKHTTKRNYNPFGDIFDTGMEPTKKKNKGYDIFDNHSFW